MRCLAITNHLLRHLLEHSFLSAHQQLGVLCGQALAL